MGWSGTGRGRGGSKNHPPFGTSHEQPCMMPTQWPITHQWATPGHTVNGSIYRSPCTNQLAPSMDAIVPAVALKGRLNALQKSISVNIERLIHWG